MYLDCTKGPKAKSANPQVERPANRDSQGFDAINSGPCLDPAENENEDKQKAEASNFSISLLELLSSHPITSERKAYIRAAAQDN